MTDTDGGDLLARAGAGDRAAFEAFVRRWEGPLFRFLERILRSTHLVEEARQVTFVRVLERAASYRGGSASAWIFQVAYRTALDLRRRERLRQTVPLEADAPLVDASEGPAEAAAREDERARVRAAVAEMDPEDRALLWLRVAGGQTFDSVAQTLGIPESTARLRLVRALGRLRRRLGAVGPVNVGGTRWTAMKY